MSCVGIEGIMWLDIDWGCAMCCCDIRCWCWDDTNWHYVVLSFAE